MFLVPFSVTDKPPTAHTQAQTEASTKNIFIGIQQI